MAAYARVNQTLRSGDDNRAALVALEKAIAELKFFANTPIIIAHFHGIEAALLFFKGLFDDALVEIERAERVAHENDNPWVLFETSRLRARIYQAMTKTEPSKRAALAALQLAEYHGWKGRGYRLKQEFPFLAENQRRALSHRDDSEGKKTIKLSQHLSALLEVSHAAASHIDPSVQAKVALDEVIRIVGAERAYLFELEEGQLVSKGGRDHTGKDLVELTGFSRTVVNRVLKEKKLVLLSGSKDGEVDPSQSVIAFNLKSIIAVPLIVNEAVNGVLYLDNRMAKGAFQDENAEIITAIAGQLAIAIESARLNRGEMKRQALEKDLEVSGAVQSLFLPQHRSFETKSFEVDCFYHPATFCGGDWWWYNENSDGSVSIVLGDVTGHGPGPAMVTAAVSTLFKNLPPNVGEDFSLILPFINEQLISICKGTYSLALSAIRVNADRNEIQWWNCGGLHPLYMTKSEQQYLISGPSSLLGSKNFEFTVSTHDFNPGDRFLIYTDGITELKLQNGRQLGIKRLKSIVLQTASRRNKEAVSQIANSIKDFGKNQDSIYQDDLTFVLLSRKKI